VREQEGGARITFESALRGLESALPEPLAKRAAEPLPLRVEVSPAARGERDRVSISLGTLARAELQRRRQGGAMAVQRTAVWLSPDRDQPIRLSERPGTLVYGSLLSTSIRLPLLATGRRGERVTTDFAGAEVRSSTHSAGGCPGGAARSAKPVVGNISTDDSPATSYRTSPAARRRPAQPLHHAGRRPGRQAPRPRQPGDCGARLVARGSPSEKTYRARRGGGSRVGDVAHRTGEDVNRTRRSPPGMWHAAPRAPRCSSISRPAKAGLLERVGQPAW
jgi:hypothetical protein